MPPSGVCPAETSCLIARNQRNLVVTPHLSTVVLSATCSVWTRNCRLLSRVLLRAHVLRGIAPDTRVDGSKRVFVCTIHNFSRVKMLHATDDNMNRLMQECGRNCLETFATCTAAAAHCLEMGGEHAGREHQTTLLDCARLSATAAEFILRGSPMHHSVCGVCAIACRVCESYCRSLSEHDSMMVNCANMCARSADSCERMSGDYR